jgi:hypothetical protein
MPRKRRPLTFKHVDLLRILRTYQTAGLPQPIVKITREGDLIAIPGESNGAAAQADTPESIIKQL